MPLQNITPTTPTNIVALYASDSPSTPGTTGTPGQYGWIAYTTDGAGEYRDRMVARVRDDAPMSAALKSWIMDVQARYAQVNVKLLVDGIPHAEAKARKWEAIEHYLRKGHPLCNPEARRIERGWSREEQEYEKEILQAERAEKELLRQEQRGKELLYRWPAAPEGSYTIYAEEEWSEGQEPVVVRVGSTNRSAAACNRSIGFSMLAHPFTPQAKRARDQKERAVRRRLRLLEVHPRAGIKQRKEAWERQLGLRR